MRTTSGRFGCQDAACEISYAVLGSLLNESGSTAIRCVALSGGTEYVSNSVEVALSMTPVISAAGMRRFSSMKSAPLAAVLDDDSDDSVVGSSNTGNESGGENGEYVTITIKYMIDQNGIDMPVFSPYVATLQKGTSFSATVPSPTYVGYSPSYTKDGEYDDASSVALNYTDLTENQEVTVWYRPAEVSYICRYFLQNISNDAYTEAVYMMQNGRALTGSYPKESVEIDIDGFTSLFHEPDTVAADGSTEFNCYYDRNYYLYNFDCNGGYGVEPVYARYGTPILINTPTRAGYTFEGWDREVDGQYDGEPDSPLGSIGLGNLTYRAIWKPSTTSFTVVYWAENANGSGYSYLTSHTYENQVTDIRIKDTDLEQFKLTSNPKETAYPYYKDADYLVYDAVKTAANNTFVEEQADNGQSVNCFHIKGDGSTTINIVYTRKEYTLKFFYAKSQVENGETKYYVVGGSTYHFGWANTNDERTMLEAENNVSGVWGQVEKQPELNENGKLRSYTLGSEIYNGVTYYYLSFKAKYGADISGLWPASIFQPVKRTTKNTHGKWDGMLAYRSAWNAEPYVKYTQDHLNGNQTIKGVYQKLDRTILYDLSKFTDSDTVRYLCFWENGANIGWSVPKLFIYELCVPVLEGEKADLTYNGTEYKLYIPAFNTYDNSNVDAQTASALEGFTFVTRDSESNEKTSDGLESTTVRFFYSRNEHKLEFYNYNNEGNHEYTVPYGTPISAYMNRTENLDPLYPSSLEPGAYEFDGWYPAPHGQGTKIEATTDLTMPDADATLYAYWKPVNRKVTFSNTYDDMVAGNYLNIGNAEENGKNLYVNHGDYLDTAKIPTPSASSLGEGDYVFLGWFYIDDETGEKKAFEINSMTVTEDMDLFAEWQSPKAVPYTVHYQFKDESGNTLTISDDTKGYSYAGMTKTFTAKAGTELNAGYQSHYYPVTNSHSILMGAEKDNEYTFEYVYKESVNYTVKYVDKATGLELKSSQTWKTTDAVITEKFQVVDGYVPDAYYKRLVLSADDAQNVITFYYTQDTQHAIYVVKHMIEELDGSYSEYLSIQGYGDLGNEIEEMPIPISGFQYDQDTTKEKNDTAITVTKDGASGKLTADGLEILLYYSRNEYDYTINYLEYGTDTVLKDPVGGKASYGSTVTVGEDKIPAQIMSANAAYHLISSGRYILITEDKTLNVLNMYYQAQHVTFNYIAICNYPGAENFGSVSPAQETVNNLSNLTGSTPTAGEGYVFAGWYTDAACTAAVDPAWVNTDGTNTNTLKPGMMPDEAQNAAFYYALFEPKYIPLTLEKEVTGNFGDRSEAFTFTIALTEGKYEEIPSSIKVTSDGETTNLTVEDGKATVRLKHGQAVTLSLPNGCGYTITEDIPVGYETKITASEGISIDESAGKAEGKAEKPSEVTYTNTKNASVPTGVDLELAPYAMIAGLALMTGVLLSLKKRRRTGARR